MPYSRIRFWCLVATLACLCVLAACQSVTEIQGAESSVKSTSSGYRVTFERDPLTPFCQSTTAVEAPKWRIKWSPPSQ